MSTPSLNVIVICESPNLESDRSSTMSGRPAISISTGTVTSDGHVTVRFAKGGRLGAVEESFIGRMRPGDRFQFAGKTLERAQQINDEIEVLIRACPAQYLWGYNRYKRPRGAELPPGQG